MPQKISESFISRCAEFQKAASKQQFLKRFGSEFGICNITHFLSKTPASMTKGGTAISTYSQEWQTHYFDNDFDCVDPVLSEARDGSLPIDWDSIALDTSAKRAFFGEASEFGISKQGITVPVRGLYGETSLVSFNSNEPSSEWKALQKHKVADLVYFSHLLHDAILQADNSIVSFDEVALTPREKQVLIWAARGKTCWETGQILKLTEQTVGNYLKKAMLKLEVKTKPQAVAKAIAENHIPYRSNHRRSGTNGFPVPSPDKLSAVLSRRASI